MAEEISNSGRVITALPAWKHRLKIGFVGFLFIVLGAWFLRDGLTTYPKENLAAHQRGDPDVHTDLDINLQIVLGSIAPLVGLAFFVRVLMRSRGKYVFDGIHLSMPGHPLIPLAAITRIDRRRWDRKGIALIDYELDDGKKGTFEMDDFYFERVPTDLIFDKIVEFAEMAGDAPAAPPAVKGVQ